MTDDPFATGQVRERVLHSWAAAPVRFREDANAEEDQAVGSYRDRLVVELAQNAADAAVDAGAPGRLLLALRELDGRAVLVAANTGAALSPDGVLALATLRASAKRDATAVGRFGVGFSAVLAVTDEPVVISRSGGVRFSAADTRALVSAAAQQAPALAEELARRDGHVPVLRLPFPAHGVPPVGYDTAVLLPLRDAAAQELVDRLLAEITDPLLLALPALAEVVVERPDQPTRRLADVASRWHVHRGHGHLDPALLADRPSEERHRTGWSITWALPRSGVPGVRHGPGVVVPGVVHAPTVTDEPLPWPGVLIAGFPLDPGRRHVAPGPATAALVGHAATGYAELLHQRALAGAPVWPLIPVGLAAGALDGALREALRPLLPDTPLLTAAEQDLPASADGPLLLRPRDAVVLEPPAGADPVVVAGLAPVIAGLVLAPRSAAGVLDLLGVRRIALADVVDQLPTPHDPAWWFRLYAALAGLAADPLAREALAALPVPLADGRVVRGVRSLALPGPDSDEPDLGEALAALGVRVVHPEAAHPLLEQLGAVPLDARAALDLPAVRSSVRAASADDDLELAAAVLDVVAAAVDAGRLAPGDLPWLADLPLPDGDDDVSPAAVLALPGSFAAEVFDPDDIALVADEAVERWGADALAAVGVLDGPAVLRLADVALTGPGAEPDDEFAEGPGQHDLDGWADWAEEAVRLALAAVGVDGDGDRDGDGDGVAPGEGVVGLEVGLGELVALRDLDAVVDSGWPRMLDRIAATPRLRAAVLQPARVVVRWVGGGGAADVPSYTAWWLTRTIAGGPWADPEADPSLALLLPPPPALLAGLDRDLRRAAGGVRTASELDAAAVEAVLAGMADPDVEMDAPTALLLWRELAVLAASVLADGTQVAPPAWVRVLDGLGTRVVRAREAVVVDGPAWLQRPDLGGAVVAPTPAAAAALADLLDVPLAPELALGKVEETGQVVPVPAGVQVLLPDGPPSWCEHEEVLVDGFDVDWWVEGRGREALVHASTFEGLAKGLSWAAGAWHRRGAVSDVLADPGALALAVVDEAFG